MFKTYTNKCYARTIWHKIFILPGFAFVLCPFSRNKVAAITTYDLHPDYTDRTTVPCGLSLSILKNVIVPWQANSV